MCKHCIIKEKGTVDFDTYYDKIFKTLHMESEVAMDDDDESWGSDTITMGPENYIVKYKLIINVGYKITKCFSRHWNIIIFNKFEKDRF